MGLSPILFLVVLCAVILTTATAVIIGLLRKNPEHATYKKVFVIIKSWWLIVGALLGALAIGKWGVLALFFAINIFVIREYLKYSQIHFKQLLALILIGVVVFQYLTLITGSKILFLAVPAFVIPIVVPLVVIFTNSVVTLPLVFSSTLGLLLLTHFMSYIPALAWIERHLWAGDQELLAIAFLLLLTEANDVLQFLSGKAFGRRKPLPMISPNKTEAGFIGGLILTPCLAMLLLPLISLSVRDSLIIGVAVAFVGMLGDLMFSAIKRYFGTKDFSDALPGHGGVLDRMDSVILTAPIYFHLLMALRNHPL